MSTWPKVACPVCGRSTSVTPSGAVRKHRDQTGGSSGYWCDASGELTREGAVRAELALLAELVKRYPKEARDFVAWLP